MKQNFKNIFAGFAIFLGVYFLVDLNENEAMVITMLVVFVLVVYNYFKSNLQLDFARYSLVLVGSLLGYGLSSFLILI